MKKWIVVALAVVTTGCAVAWAGSPARVTGSVATNGTGTAFAVPVSGGVGFRLQSVLLNATVGTTQTVSIVCGNVTNTCGAKVIASGDKQLVVTNAPWLFAGDSVRVAPSAGQVTTFPAVLVGETQD